MTIEGLEQSGGYVAYVGRISPEKDIISGALRQWLKQHGILIFYLIVCNILAIMHENIKFCAL